MFLILGKKMEAFYGDGVTWNGRLIFHAEDNVVNDDDDGRNDAYDSNVDDDNVTSKARNEIELNLCLQRKVFV